MLTDGNGALSNRTIRLIKRQKYCRVGATGRDLQGSGGNTNMRLQMMAAAGDNSDPKSVSPSALTDGCA
jgi:hypothetical protein